MKKGKKNNQKNKFKKISVVLLIIGAVFTVLAAVSPIVAKATEDFSECGRPLDTNLPDELVGCAVENTSSVSKFFDKAGVYSIVIGFVCIMASLAFRCRAKSK